MRPLRPGQVLASCCGSFHIEELRHAGCALDLVDVSVLDAKHP